jgi:thiamine-phosphate pyrophosphorylase
MAEPGRGDEALRRALRLVAITDDLRDGADGLRARAVAAVTGGATMVQVRLKDADARTLAEVTRALVTALPVPVLVNDRFDVALAAGAAGVHLGADDLPVADVRRCVPPGFVIGASYGSDAERAGTLGADYVGIGPVHATATKGDAGAAIGIDGLARLRAQVALPCVGIGGITPATARAVLDAGADGIAVVSALFGAPDPAAAARAFRAVLDA